MTWDMVRAFVDTNRERPGELPAEIVETLSKAMHDLLSPGDFVVYERHDPATIGRMVRRERDRKVVDEKSKRTEWVEGDRYVIADVRTGEEEWVGCESLLRYGKPSDEWFRGTHPDHKDLFLPLYLSTTFDALVEAWETVDAKLRRKDERWRLVSELKRAWVPRWGKREVEWRRVVRLPENHTIISWDTTTSPHRLLIIDNTTIDPSLATVRDIVCDP